jgi:hypothetical protein
MFSSSSSSSSIPRFLNYFFLWGGGALLIVLDLNPDPLTQLNFDRFYIFADFKDMHYY